MQGQRPPNKVRTAETNDVFRDKVLKTLKLKSLPSSLDNCQWEKIYKLLMQAPIKPLMDQLALATAHQDLCLATVLLHAEQLPNEDIMEAAATGDSAILRLYLGNPNTKIPYQALVAAVVSGKEENVRLLLADKRTTVNPSVVTNQPSLLTTAVKRALAAGNGSGREKIVSLVLADKRIDPSGSDNSGLEAAAYANNVPMLRLLLNAGADPNHGKSPFIAATVGNLEAVTFLASDPRVDFTRIPVAYLRTMESNRSGQPGVRANVNNSLPAKSRQEFIDLAELLNTKMYGDKIAGVFLGFFLATGASDSSITSTITKLFTGSSATSRFLRYVTLENPTLNDTIDWFMKHVNEFTGEEWKGITTAAGSVESDKLRGNIAISAFYRLALGWTFQEIYEEVSRKRFEQRDEVMTAMLLGGFMGLERSLDSGVAIPPSEVLVAADRYTRDTNFAVLRPLS